MRLKPIQVIDYAIAFWLVLFMVSLFWLQGCSVPRCPDPAPAPPPGVADHLRSIGSSFLTWGAISLGLGVVLRIVLAVGSTGLLGPFVAILSRFGGAISLAASSGAVAVAVGAAFTWLADYLWATVLACLLAGVAWAWYHRRDIRRWLVRLSASGKVKD